MRFCVATVCSNTYADICAVTTPNKNEYARRHGYDCIIKYESVPYPQVFFRRLRWFLELLESKRYDWVFCCGGDVIFTNLTIPLTAIVGPDDHFIIAKDALTYQSDVFIVRASEKGTAFMRAWADSEPQFCKSEMYDQDAFAVLHPQFMDTIRVVPQRVLQGYDYDLYTNLGGNYAKALDANGNDGQWKPGDFAFHVPAHMDRKIAILKEKLNHVVK